MFKFNQPWQEGRQCPGYKKKLIYQIGKLADCYLIKYPAGFKLPPHHDPVSHGKHFRLNITLYGSGEFKCEKTILHFKRLVLFRPDINTHSFDVDNNTRLVLSFGFVI